MKSMKRSLQKVTGNVTLIFEEFCTVFAEIEECLNSRPLALMMMKLKYSHLDTSL